MQGEDFVYVEDNVLTEETCQNAIEAFLLAEKCGTSYSRKPEEVRLRKDLACDFNGILSLCPTGVMTLVTQQIHNRIHNYITKYANGMVNTAVLPEDAQYPLHPTGHKMQRTLPSEGYHMWHSENSNLINKSRAFSWILYLNDVEQGGETEFLYLSKRVQPKAGRILIFPAGFTHAHRGNPPLSGEKYIATGWVEYAE
jgi:hypothetical protein